MLIPNQYPPLANTIIAAIMKSIRNNYGLNNCGRINRTVCAIIFFHKYKDKKKIKYRFFNLKYFLNWTEL